MINDLEQVARSLVENAVLSAQKWLNNDTSVCYCGLSKNIAWMISDQEEEKCAVFGKNLIAQNISLVEKHLRECLKKDSEEIECFLRPHRIVHRSQLDLQRHGLRDDISRQYSEMDVMFENKNCGYDCNFPTHIYFPLKISVEVPTSLWRHHLATLPKCRSSIQLQVMEDGRINDSNKLGKCNGNNHDKALFYSSNNIELNSSPLYLSSSTTQNGSASEIMTTNGLPLLSGYHLQSGTDKQKDQPCEKKLVLPKKALVKYLRISYLTLQNFKEGIESLSLKTMEQNQNDQAFASLKQQASHELLAQDLSREIDYYLNQISKRLRNEATSEIVMDEDEQDRLNEAIRKIAQMYKILKTETVFSVNADTVGAKFQSLQLGHRNLHGHPNDLFTTNSSDPRCDLSFTYHHDNVNTTDQLSKSLVTKNDYHETMFADNDEAAIEYFV